MRDILTALWNNVLDLFLSRYYIVEFSIDGEQANFPAMHNAHLFGGCELSGVFTCWDSAHAYWQYRTEDTYDPGFIYTITRISKNSDLVREFFTVQKEREANGFS